MKKERKGIMNWKKTVSILLAMALGTSLLTGCGGTGKGAGEGTANSNSSNTTDSSTQAQGEEVIELTFYNADGKDDPWTDPVALAITEATGIKLKTDYPVAADDQKVALMIAEQKFPDMIFAKGGAAQLIEAGALIDMTELIDEYGPNIKKLYGEEYEKLKYSGEDPSIYQLSSYAVGGKKYTSSGNAQIQWAALKAKDYQIPKTLDEYETMIKDYLKDNPQTEDGLDNIGLTLSASDWHWLITLGNPAGYIAEGAPDNGQWLVDENYNGIYKFRTEKMKEYFRWLNRMYHEGILDSEFATQTHEDYIAKIASGRVVALMDADWDYADGEKVLKADGKIDKTYAPLAITMDKSTKSAVLMYQGLTTGWGVGITTSCKDPISAIKFLDYLCSDEGQILVNWGVEGINYTVDENGKRVRNEEEIKNSLEDKDYAKKTGVGYHTYPFPTYGPGMEGPDGNTYTPVTKESTIAEYNEEQLNACKAWGVELLIDVFPQPEEFEIPKYSAIWAYTKPVEFDETANQLDEIAWSSLITCIIGEEADFDKTYDKMIEELEKTGMAEAEQMLTDILKEKVALVND